MYDDSGVRLAKLKVDGGMANNKLFLQMLSDIVGINVATPSLCETTALGVALAAGKAKGIDLFKLDDENEIETEMSAYVPRIRGQRENSFGFISSLFAFVIVEREDNFNAWKKAVIKSFERATVPFNIENKGKSYSIRTEKVDRFHLYFSFQGPNNDKTHLSTTAVAWMTLTSIMGVLFYMASHDH